MCNATRSLIGDTAQVVGTVTAEDVVVRGRVEGVIRGIRVTLQGQAHGRTPHEVYATQADEEKLAA
jgi:cytoskeletal protein CcmA (bactofilin family)